MVVVAAAAAASVVSYHASRPSRLDVVGVAGWVWVSRGAWELVTAFRYCHKKLVSRLRSSQLPYTREHGGKDRDRT